MVDKIIEYILNKNRLVGIVLIIIAIAIFLDGAFNTFARFKQIPNELSIPIGLVVIISFSVIVGTDKVGNYSSKARGLARFLVFISVFIFIGVAWSRVVSQYPNYKDLFTWAGMILVIIDLIIYFIFERKIRNPKLFNILFFEFSDGASEEVPKDRYITYSVQKELSKKFRGTKVSIMNVREVVIDDSKAYLRGKNAEAIAVIYGIYSKRNKNIMLDLKFEVIKQPIYYQPVDLQTKILPMGELDNGHLEVLIEMNYVTVTNFLIGLFEYSSGNFKEAIETFNSIAVETYTVADFSSLKNDVVYLYLGNSYYMIGDMENSKLNLKKALSANRNNPKVLHNLGVIEYQLGNVIDSINLFSEALTLDDQLLVAYRNRAFVFIKQKEYQKALVDLLKFLDLNPFDADALKLAAICKKNLDHHHEAIIYFKFAQKASFYDLNITLDLIDEYITVKDYLRAIIASSIFIYHINKLSLILGFWADKFMELKRYKLAEIIYGVAILFKQGNYSLYFSRSNSRINADKLNSAIRDLRRVIELKPDFIDAYFNLGNAYMVQGKFEQAKEIYSKGISLSPMYGDFYFSRAQANLILKEYTEAIRDCEEYINLTQSEDVKIFELLGIAFLGLSVFEMAVDYLEKVYRSLPSERNKKNLYSARRAYEEYLLTIN